MHGYHARLGTERMGVVFSFEHCYQYTSLMTEAATLVRALVIRHSTGASMRDKRSSDICHILTIVDGESDEVLDFIEIANFNLPAFAHQFAVPLESDPEMLDRYAIGPDDVTFIEKQLNTTLSFDFSVYAYFIEAVVRE